MNIQFKPAAVETALPASITEEQAARARYVNSSEFLNARSNPFLSEQYRNIGFPFSAGRITPEGEEVEQIRSYVEENGRRGAIVHGERYTYRGRTAPYYFEPGYLTLDLRKPIEEQFIGCSKLARRINRHIAEIDFAIYGQPKLQIAYQVDAIQLANGKIHRAENVHWHADAHYGESKEVEDRLKLVREGKRGQEIGLTRVYTAASECPTEFRNREFEPWEIAHFMAEEHNSPVVPTDCIRIFYRAWVVPLRTSP